MKFKARVTMSDTIELDTDNYESDTPEDCIEEQKKFWDEGGSDPGEMIGFGDEYKGTLELVKKD